MQIQWYPGHMAKAKRLLMDQLARVDLVLELCDARIPVSSRNPDLMQLAPQKKRILILNKADLAQEPATQAWIAAFKAQGLDAMPFIASQARPKALLSRMERATAELVARQAARGIKKTVRAMIVGVPNVGKSTLINCLSGSAIAKVGDKPGVTRANQWVRVTPYLELLDTPGLLWPRQSDALTAQRLAYIGTIRDVILDAQHLAILLLEDLLAMAPQAVCQRFRITDPSLRGPALLEAVCFGRGFLLPGGVADTERGAAVVLDEFRGGKCGRITLENLATAPEEGEQP